MKLLKPGQLYTFGKNVYKCTKVQPLHTSYNPTKCMICIRKNKSEMCPLLIHRKKYDMCINVICFIIFRKNYPLKIR